MSNEGPNKWWKDWPQRKEKLRHKHDARLKRTNNLIQKYYDELDKNKTYKRDIESGKAVKKKLKEDVPTNSMGLSSSTSGPVQTYDPLLGQKDKRKKRIEDMWRRMLGRK